MNSRRFSALAAAAVAAASLLAGCAVPDQSQPDIISSSRAAAQPTAVSLPPTKTSTRVALYFVNGSNLLTAVYRSNPVGGLERTVTALLAGPTNQDIASGLTSAIPVGTKLESARMSGSTASLDFSQALASVSGREQLLAFAQIVVTADSLPNVARVAISVGGQAVNAPEPGGTLAQGPVTRADYAALITPLKP